MMDNVKKFILMEKLGDLFVRKQDLKTTIPTKSPLYSKNQTTRVFIYSP